MTLPSTLASTARPEEAAPQPEPEETARRTAASSQSAISLRGLPFSAVAGAPGNRSLVGCAGWRRISCGSAQNWNGMLVMYAHGYGGTGPTVNVSDPPIREHLIRNGYAWARPASPRTTTTCALALRTRNGLALGIPAHRSSKRPARWRHRPRPTSVGTSMGGHIAAAAVDAETQETANNKVRYDGPFPCAACWAIPSCTTTWRLADRGPAAGWHACHHLARAQLGGTRAPRFAPHCSPPSRPRPPLRVTSTRKSSSNSQAASGPCSTRALLGSMNATGMGHVRTRWHDQRHPQPRRLRHHRHRLPVRQRSGAHRYRAILQPDGLPAARRPRSQSPAPRRPALVPQDERAHQRAGGDHPHAGRCVRAVQHGADLKRRAMAQGTDKWLVQRAIRGVSHCDFTVEEQAPAFDAMALWDERGVKPRVTKYWTAPRWPTRTTAASSPRARALRRLPSLRFRRTALAAPTPGHRGHRP